MFIKNLQATERLVMKMGEEHKKGLDAELVWEDLQACCLSGISCSLCQGKSCTIGYAKQCIEEYRKAPKKEVPEGVEHVPSIDLKAFNEDRLETAIAHILKECKDCKEDHTENCIINVIRNCYEVDLFGETHQYEGSALQYLMYLKEHFPEHAEQIASMYKK